MTNNKFQKNSNETILYNSILLLSRNKIFYTKFKLKDTFQNRIHLIFIHISFIFIKIKHTKKNDIYKLFYQNMFDLIFSKIDENMREIGFGDAPVNKNMRFLVKLFYNILLDCEKYRKMTTKTKNILINKYLVLNDDVYNADNTGIIKYFDKYEAFCFDLNSDSVLEGKLKFIYN